jgi:hypothetical protein
VTFVGWVEVRNPTNQNIFGTRFRPMGRVHFLCLPKENEPKEKAPLVLACGSPIKMAISGKSKKLAALRHSDF